MSKLTDFYCGVGTDAAGRTFEEVMQFGPARLEFVHDYIQWLFPLREPSNFNPDAPLLTDEDIKLWKANPLMQENLLRATELYLDFLGFEIVAGNDNDPANQDDVTVQKASHFEEECRGLFTHPNHNWFRISRVLGCLTLIGDSYMVLVAKAFYKCLEKVHEEDGLVSENSFSYWKVAVNVDG